MIKLPRTLHLDDSRMPNGQIDPEAIRFSSLVDKFVVIEEKVDGTGVGISFDNNANITIQTRAKPASAKQFTQLYGWANEHMNQLWELVGDRYIMFGEWMYAKHTIFYDNLCHYFLESDMYDREKEIWLTTFHRQELIDKYARDLICSVPIIKMGRVHPKDNLQSFVQTSFFKTPAWQEKLEFFCNKYHYDYEQIMRETDPSMLMEGLYIKHEDRERVLGRFKYIRYDFLQTILKSGSHYKDRAIIPNMVAQM